MSSFVAAGSSPGRTPLYRKNQKMAIRRCKRYALFQAPGWAFAALALLALTKWFGLPLWAASGLFVVWVVKDILLYPLVRTAYECDVKTGVEQLAGEKGVTQEWLVPCGMVRVRGELWQAEAAPDDQRIEPNTEIRITGARGMVLIVSREAA